MMKKFFYGAAMAALLVSMTACGGNSENTESEDAEYAASEDEGDLGTITVSVVDGKFADGDLAEFVELVPGDYTMTCTSSKGVLELKAKATAQSDKELSGNSKFGIYDENGNEIGIMLLYGGQTDLNKAMNEGDTETEYTLYMNYYAHSDFPMEEFMKKAKEIRGIMAVASKESSSSSSDSSSSDSSSNDSSSDDSSSSSDSGSTLISSSELETFISKGKSGDINKMIEALEWQNKVEAGLKSKVRALDEDAIKAKIMIDKAVNKIGEKYDTYSLAGALNNMTDQMSNSQLNKYNAACAKSVIFFSAGENSSEYNSLYRKLRFKM